MVTYWSKTLIPTLRQDPAEAEVPSHRLMLRSGLVRQLTAGIYTYLPLGWRALQKAMEIIRQEMNAAGAVEMFMPALEPIELLAETGRGVTMSRVRAQLVASLAEAFDCDRHHFHTGHPLLARANRPPRDSISRAS